MARDHHGNYSAKHPPGTTIDPELAKAVTDRIDHGRISCHAAFTLAAERSESPSLIGTAIDLQEGRLVKCQLGLFGYESGSSPLNAAESVDDDLKTAFVSALVDGRLPCESAWQIANELNLSRLAIGRACESLGIHISRCQLGAF